MSVAAAKKHQDGDCSAGSAAVTGSISAIPAEDRTISLGETFRLESGEALAEPALRVRLFHASRSAANAPSHSNQSGGVPVIAVAGGISAGRKLADAADGAGWWRALVAAGGGVDTDRFCVLGFDFLPTNEKRAVTVTAHDQARALAIALDALGIASLHGFVGASYGGFVGLAFAALYPQRVRRLCAISAAARPDPMATALRGLQRRIIALGLDTGREADAVAIARALAMTTYRSPEEFRTRFECVPLGPSAGDLYDVCGYLRARGEAYAATMPAHRYVSLSDSLDRSTIDAAAVRADCLFIASLSDRLVPAPDTESTAHAVSGRSTYVAIDSLVGHDAFLCDIGKFEQQVKEFIERE